VVQLLSCLIILFPYLHILKYVKKFCWYKRDILINVKWRVTIIIFIENMFVNKDNCINGYDRNIPLIIIDNDMKDIWEHNDHFIQYILMKTIKITYHFFK